MIPNAIEKEIKSVLLSKKGEGITILDLQPVSGGCINNATKIITNYGNFFLKWNINASEKMFDTEVKGLELLRKSKTIYIPKLIAYDYNYLMMECIEKEPPSNILWEEFGRDLSELHKVSNINFGLDHNNFIGSLPQDNKQQLIWSDFFINQRIIPQLSMGDFSSEIIKDFDKVFLKIDALFPDEPSSLLHGDLWNGNFIFLNNKTALIDPAVYFGSREMDIAMSKLFGGFHDQFYSSYNENYPLSEGWQDRIDICNLYPLLVHVNLFGGGYYSQVKTILNRFI
jgi:fructosamine-3-kinase